MRPGEPAGSAIAPVGGFGAARRAAGIPALLAGRTPLHCRPRLLRHGGADRACGGGNQDDSRGQRWSDAAEPCAAGGGGTIWDAGGAVSGAHRPGAGTGSGRRLCHHAGAATGFAPERRRFSGTAGGVADLPWAGEAGAGGQGDSRAGEQRAHHAAGVERIQRATGGHVGSAVCFCRALCSGVSVYGGANVPRTVSAQCGAAPAPPDGGRAGDCGGDRCSSPAAVHHSAAALSAIDPQSAGGVVASRGFHGAAVAGVGAGGGREPSWARPSWDRTQR